MHCGPSEGKVAGRLPFHHLPRHATPVAACRPSLDPHRVLGAAAGWALRLPRVPLHPASPEGEFSVIRGQGGPDAPLLERVAGGAAEAAEDLSAALLELDARAQRMRVVPIIVTNAELVLARFDPRAVDLGTGDVAAAAFISVGHLPFRRSLGPAVVPDEYEPAVLRELGAGAERTVFVVGAANLVG